MVHYRKTVRTGEQFFPGFIVNPDLNFEKNWKKNIKNKKYCCFFVNKCYIIVNDCKQ